MCSFVHISPEVLFLCHIWTENDFESKVGSELVIKSLRMNVKIHEYHFLGQIFKSYWYHLLILHLETYPFTTECLQLQPPSLISPQWNLVVVTGNAVQQLSSSDWILPFTRSFKFGLAMFVSSLNQKSVVGTSKVASLLLQKQRWLYSLVRLCQALCTISSIISDVLFILEIRAHLLYMSKS